MRSDPFRNALILTGPTASGKSALALTAAERMGAEIVCMDSMTLYRGMDIGTAKPSAADRRRVPHYLLDCLDPWDHSSVAWWLQMAAEICKEIEGRGRKALFVGGTPLYLKALLEGLFEGPPEDRELRRQLQTIAVEEGPQRLHDMLRTVDAEAAERLHPNDLRRVIRALEVHRTTGRSISEWQTQWSRDPDQGDEAETTQAEDLVPPRCLWLDLPREELYARINARVDAMIEAGLIDEVDRLRRSERPLGREASQALGYKEVLAYLSGTIEKDRAIEEIKTRTRRFAKRQITWFRHMRGCRPVSKELTLLPWGLRIGN